jgi:hypothetical protein
MGKLKLLGLLCSLGLLLCSEAFAQRINFSTWTGSDDIVITPIGATSSSLRFNDKEKVIRSNMSNKIEIKKDDPQVAIFQIEAPTEFDITVELDYPTFLAKDGDPSKGTIPFELRMAYTNNGQGSSTQIPNPQSAEDVPMGFNSITMPVSRRGGGAPLPPTPEYGGYTRPKSKVFLYIYGSIGPTGTISAGDYTAAVNLNVYVAGGQD